MEKTIEGNNTVKSKQSGIDTSDEEDLLRSPGKLKSSNASKVDVEKAAAKFAAASTSNKSKNPLVYLDARCKTSAERNHC